MNTSDRRYHVETREVTFKSKSDTWICPDCITMRDVSLRFRVAKINGRKELIKLILRLRLRNPAHGAMNFCMDNKPVEISLETLEDKFMNVTKYCDTIWSKKYDIAAMKEDRTFQIKLSWRFNAFNIRQERPTFFEDHCCGLYELEQEFGDMLLVPVEAKCPTKKRKLDQYSSDVRGGIKTSSLRLMSASDVFKNMLTHSMKERKDKVIQIQAESVQEIDQMVYYLTTGMLQKNSNHLDLLKMSHLYGLTTLGYACMDHLVKDISVESFVGTKSAFDRYSKDDDISKGYYEMLIWKLKEDTAMFQKLNEQKLLPIDWVLWGKVVHGKKNSFF